MVGQLNDISQILSQPTFVAIVKKSGDFSSSGGSSSSKVVVVD